MLKRPGSIDVTPPLQVYKNDRLVDLRDLCKDLFLSFNGR